MRKFDIDRKKLQEAKYCNKSFTCLGTGRSDLCKIEFSLDDKIHFIECLDDRSCPYKRDFGGRHYCDCPVRAEIHKKYKV